MARILETGHTPDILDSGTATVNHMSDPIAEAEAAGWTAMEPYPGRTDRPWLLKCDECGYECNKPLSKIREGKRCLICARKVRRLFTETSAVVEAGSAGWTAMELYPGWVDDRWLLKCEVWGVESHKTLRNIRNGSGCRTCAGLAPITEAEAVAEVKTAGWIARESYPGSVNDRWLLECNTCGEESHKRLSKIRAGSGCRSCSRRKSVTEAEALAEIKAAGWTARELYPGSVRGRWLMRCDVCGYECRKDLSHIRRGQGCRSCSGLVPVTEEEAEAEFAAAGFTLLEYPGGTHAPALVRCDACGYKYGKALDTLRQVPGCWACSGLAPVTDEEAERDFAAAGFTLLEPFPGGSITPVRVRCDACGHEHLKRLNDVRTGRGCPACADYGFDPGSPAIIYVIQRPDLSAIKVGITNADARSERVQKHERRGWEVVTIRSFVDGQEAVDIERAILSWWHDDLEVGECVHPDDMPQGGWSETAPLSVLSETLRMLDNLTGTTMA